VNPITQSQPIDDVNLIAAGLLHDMAIVQTSEHGRFAYSRAAKVLAAGLDRSVRDLLEEGTLRDVRFIGASTGRIVAEVVRTGGSPTVDKAVAASARKAEVTKRRGYRRAYLSRHVMRIVLDAPLPATIVSTKAYRGDFQMHSTWSDGVESVASLAEAAEALGWSRIGLTDHSYGLPIARGMSMDKARQQHTEIDAVNEQFAGRVRVYKGVEANILVDGLLDVQLDERREFEYVVASPHSLLRRETDQTARMVTAVRQPAVAILGHPQGRV
jgi:hypothetical protein